MNSHRPHERPARHRLLGALLATTAALSPLGAGAGAQPYPQAAAVQDVAADATGYGGQLALPIGGSRILRFTRPIGQVMVGNPKVGDVVPLGERTLYVLGKAQGGTSLTVMPRGGGAALATLDLRVGYDVDGIRRAIREVLPSEPLQVAAHGDGVVLTGTLGSSAAAARAASLAEQYAPGHVVNLTSVRGAEQVMISVRVAEVQRSVLQQLGLNNLSALWDTTGTLAFAPPVLNPDAVANLVGKATSGDWTFQTLFDALERRGFASTLAEPNLVALSGETAVFFAGGEYPIPVPQSGASLTNVITIEYKQYGVSIGFTPTVHGDSINLAVAPEVSALDPANSIILQGYRIPALTTRRAKTTVELRNGQSFAIAGLIRREFTDNLRGIPGASRAPIIGALFRSTGYQNNETEVVIIVTAHLAKPTEGKNLLTPTDVRQGPSETDLLFNGATDAPLTTGRPAASLTAPSPAAPAASASAASVAAAPAAAPAAPASEHVATAAAPPPAPAPIAASPPVARTPEARPVAAAQPAVAVTAAKTVVGAPTTAPVATMTVQSPAAPPLARTAEARPVAAAQPIAVTATKAVSAAPIARPAAPAQAPALDGVAAARTSTTPAARAATAAPGAAGAPPRTMAASSRPHPASGAAPARLAAAGRKLQPAPAGGAAKVRAAPPAATASARAALPWSAPTARLSGTPEPLALAQAPPAARAPSAPAPAAARAQAAAASRKPTAAASPVVDLAVAKPAAADKLLVSDPHKPAAPQSGDAPAASAGGR